jgi:hypothetical protein
MKPILPLFALCILAGSALPAQTLSLEDITAKYDELFCNKIERSPDQEAFREKALVDTLYERVLILPAGAVREAEREGALVQPKAPWIFFNPQTNAVHLVLPPDAGGKAIDAYTGRTLASLFKAGDPVKICTGRQDVWNRHYFNLQYSMTAYAPDRASLEAVRSGKAPLKLRILHLEEKLPNAHDLYLHFTGVLER